VRSWGRRYGLLPPGRSPGGHRRYTEADLACLVRMQTLVAGGATPAAAAAVVSAERSGVKLAGGAAALAGPDPAAPAIRGRKGNTRSGGPAGRVLAVPGASARAQGLARAAGRLDAEAIGKILSDLLQADGAITTWEEVLRPVLAAAGVRWARTGEGIYVEHVLTEATIDALRAHRARQLPPVAGRQVLLACCAGDLHVLPLHVVGVALAERRVPTLLLGAQVPGPALVSSARRTRATGIFLCGVGDRRPGVLGNARDGFLDLRVQPDSDRHLRPGPYRRGHRGVSVERGVRPQQHRSGRVGCSQPGQGGQGVRDQTGGTAG